VQFIFKDNVKINSHFMLVDHIRYCGAGLPGLGGGVGGGLAVPGRGH